MTTLLFALRSLRLPLIIALVVLSFSPLHADPGKRQGPPRPPGPPQPEVPWKWLGPSNLSGRVRTIVIHPQNANIIWVGAATGGIWKSLDGGASWTPLDEFLPSLTVSTLAMDPANPNVLYAGTGEIFTLIDEGMWPRGMDRGAGIFKTADGGSTWTVLAETQTPEWYYVSRIAVHPTNPNVLLAATASGIWRSANAGVNWTMVKSGVIATDVKFHPRAPDHAVAGTFGNLALFSTDAGQSWMPSTFLHSVTASNSRIELGANPSLADDWRAIHVRKGSNFIFLLSSQNGGQTFDHVSPTQSRICSGGPLTSCTDSNRGGCLSPSCPLLNNNAYTGVVWVDPNDAERILVGGVQLSESLDGGNTFTQVFRTFLPHSDWHAIVEYPDFEEGDNRVLVGNDGGVFRVESVPGATPPVSESLNNGLRIAQLYSGRMSPANGDLIGGAQDIGTLLKQGDTWRAVISDNSDGTVAAIDPVSPQFLYGGKSVGRIFRSTNGGDSFSCIYATPSAPMLDALNNADCGDGITFTGKCFNITPVFLDPLDSNRLYVGCNRLWRTLSAKAGDRNNILWEVVKAADGDHLVTAIDIDPNDQRHVWVGTGVFASPTYHGKIWKTTNVGPATAGSWTDVSLNKGLPDRPVSRVIIHPRRAGTVYASFAGWAPDNVWRTADGGAIWQNISGDLPDVPVWSFAVHPTRNDWLYAGTDIGLYISTNNGANWSKVTKGQAVVPVTDLSWLDNHTLVVATYGRGSSTFDATPNPERITPDALSYETGSQTGGHIENLDASDNRRLSSTASRQVPIQIVVVLSGQSGFTRTETPDLSSARSYLEFFLESAPKANSTLSISLFNYRTGQWVEFLNKSVSANLESAQRIKVSSGVRDYLGTRSEVKARVVWALPSTGLVALGTLMDAAGWRITRP